MWNSVLTIMPVLSLPDYFKYLTRNFAVGSQWYVDEIVLL